MTEERTVESETAPMSATGVAAQTPPAARRRARSGNGNASRPAPGTILEQGGEIPEPRETVAPFDYTETVRALQEGDVIRGTVVHIGRDGVLVDVGMKSEGLILPNELSREPGRRPEQIVSVGQEIDVYVMSTDEENEAGQLILSKKRADFEKAWDRVIEAQKAGETIEAMVTERVKGGLVVDLGIRGFVPASHVGTGKVRNLEKFIGTVLPLKVIEVDRDRRKVVLSHRLATEQERAAQRAETLETLAEGQVRTGIVRRITDYGAFVDIGGVDGLLHISEMSWTRIKHPSDVLKVGDEIQVMVLKVNLEQERISLGLRQILPDPWTEAQEKYHPGQLVTGQVTRLVPFGAFVQLEGGLEGIVPNNELSPRRVNKPEEVVQVGDEVQAKVLEVRPEERRMTLSIRQALEETGDYGEYAPEEDRLTLGDVYGAMLGRRGRGERAEEEEEEEE